MAEKINVNGIAVNYQLDQSSSGASNAPVVMLSNSLLSNLRIWDAQIEALTPHYRVLRYDTRGHGETEAPKSAYTAEMFADDVAALLDALEIERVHFVGLSLGGFIAQPVAQKYPDRLASLTICGAACRMGIPAAWENPIAIAESQGMEALIPANVERWFTEPFRNAGGAKIKAVQKMVASTPVHGFVNTVKAFQYLNQCAELPKISAPTLVMVGEHDPACPVSAAEELHQGIPNSKLKILKGASHLPNLEQPEAFNATLIAFLDEQPTVNA